MLDAAHGACPSSGSIVQGVHSGRVEPQITRIVVARDERRRRIIVAIRADAFQDSRLTAAGARSRSFRAIAGMNAAEFVNSELFSSSAVNWDVQLAATLLGKRNRCRSAGKGPNRKPPALAVRAEAPPRGGSQTLAPLASARDIMAAWRTQTFIKTGLVCGSRNSSNHKNAEQKTAQNNRKQRTPLPFCVIMPPADC